MNKLLVHENRARKDGYRFIIGIDEAGRGPLAGPVVAAAVFLFNHDFSCVVHDSKQMTAVQRECAFIEICNKAVIGVGVMNEAVIDEHNILQATFFAMNAAVRRLMSRAAVRGQEIARAPEKICMLIDGNRFQSEVPYAFRTIVDGDALSLTIACASIIAKVTRDRILDKYHQVFPQYGFDSHRGYATDMHREAIKRLGTVFIHRKTFGSVREYLGGDFSPTSPNDTK
ncbi:MAG: ribonuclease HII [Candidatus Omnitrophota bacterium]